MTGAEKTFKARKVLKDRKKLKQAIEEGGLGRKLGILRVLAEDKQFDMGPIPTDDEKLCVWIAKSIIKDLLTRHKRIDHREHWAMIDYMVNLGFELVHLKTGDGDFKSTKVSIERKEDDFIASLFDGRRLRQLSAMRETAEYSYLVVTKSYADVKAGALERGISEAVVTGYIASLCAIGYPPLFIDNKYDASRIVHRLVEKIEDDVTRTYVARPAAPLAVEYRNAIIESLPGIGAKTRRKLTVVFPSIASLSNASFDELMEVEGIGKKTAERMIEILSE